MNCYSIDDCALGLKETFQAKITPEIVKMFTDLSGDINPLHTNEAFAKSKGFPGRVVYGMLTASFYSTLAGVYLPGKNCLLYAVDSKFAAPVYIGDLLTVSGEVINRFEQGNGAGGIITIKAHILNQSGVEVSRAKITAGILESKENSNEP